MKKDQTVKSLIEHLDLPRRGWTVVDHWEADLCAIGVASLRNTRRLVYVSTFGTEDGRFDYQCEVASGASVDEYRITRSGNNVSLRELIEVMEEHLC